jgi:8-oxo-dGTP pyrophosphatase MutT (NUDIX family)
VVVCGIKMDATVSRSALILYCPAEPRDQTAKASGMGNASKVCALFGRGRSGLTTLGGRISSGETWLDCLVRELIEETRGILNYSLYKEIFQTARNFCFDQCIYVLFETTYDVLVSIAAQFPFTTSGRDVCNEMLSLEVCPIDDLIKDMVVERKNRYNETFQNMFLTIGYDTLKGNTCNHLVSRIDLDAEIYTPISRLPRVVCLTPIKKDIPIVYGTILSRNLYITDQYYLDDGERRLFRSGYMPKTV